MRVFHQLIRGHWKEWEFRIMKVIEVTTKKKYEELEAKAAERFKEEIAALGLTRYNGEPVKGEGDKYRFLVSSEIADLYPDETIVDFDGDVAPYGASG